MFGRYQTSWQPRNSRPRSCQQCCPTATQRLQQPERGSVLLKPISCFASKPISFFVWLNSTHARLYFAFGIFNHNQMQGKGCSHVLMRTRKFSRLYSSICFHETKTFESASSALKPAPCAFKSFPTFDIIYVFWRPKPNLLTMVEITTRVQISFQDEKPVTIPHELLFEHDGQKWLKLRPTAQPIVQLIHGGRISKNASLSSSNALKSLLDARNTAFLQSPPGLEASNGENLFEDPPKQPKKKQKLLDENRIVHLEVGDHKVQCLMFGNRPTRSDLAILLDPNHL